MDKLLSGVRKTKTSWEFYFYIARCKYFYTKEKDKFNLLILEVDFLLLLSNEIMITTTKEMPLRVLKLSKEANGDDIHHEIVCNFC